MVERSFRGSSNIAFVFEGFPVQAPIVKLVAIEELQLSYYSKETVLFLYTHIMVTEFTSLDSLKP